MLRATLLVLVVIGVGGCGGAESNQSSPASPPPSGGASATTEFPQSIGAARSDLDKDEHDVQLASSDCQAACKALASMERAADQLCLVAEPQECSDARVRVDRAKRAVSAQCGGC